MLKKFSKLLILLLVVLTICSFSSCFATDAVVTSETESQAEDTTSTDNIHYGDLYLVGNDIVLDKIVYGSVFIIGNTVEVIGQIENDLYVIANTLKIDASVTNGGLVQGKIYALANSIDFNGACSYLYTICNNIDMTYYSYVVGNAKIASSKATILSAIGRDLELLCNKANFGEANNIAAIYGNLTYASLNDIEIPEGIVSKDITHKRFISTLHNYSFKNIIVAIISATVTVLALYFILNKFTLCFVEKLNNKKLSAFNLLKAFGIGLATILLTALASLLLLITVVGAKLGIILALVFVVLCFVSVPALSIAIAKALKPVLKIEKTVIFLLILSAVSIALYGLTLIPFAGIILNLIIKVTAIGLIVYNYLPHKELSDEEKAKKAEAKKLKKEEKQKRKQEKLEAKAAKKAEKENKKKEDNL